MSAAREQRHLRGPVLRSVSRSFYLSLRFLPGPLRDPLSLAYLLARATDTIADTPEPAAESRLGALRDLAAAIQGAAPGEAAARLRDSFAPRQTDGAERELIQALPAALEWLEMLEEGDRRELRSVLGKITRGQMLDLERFGSGTANRVHALATAAELDEYTYLVAGCVGEFWTRLCFAHLPRFSSRPESEMRELGIQYGKGLQLINILRDAGADLKNGRCYFPAEELKAVGLTEAEILREPARIELVLGKWREKAGKGIEAGIEYACATHHRRVRFATALPALIGARTLALLREAGAHAITQRVKVPRGEVRQLVLSSALASPRSLRARFEHASRNGDLKSPS